MSKVKVPCDNFDGEHYSPDFLHPCDEAKIKNSKEELAARRGGGGRNSERGGRCRDLFQSYCKNWSNDKKDGDRHNYGNGVQKGAMMVCDIAVVTSVDVMTPILLDLMPLGSVILALFPCLLNMMIGNCQVILMVS